MLKYIIISLGTLLGVFLIYKLFTTPKLYRRWAVINKARLILIIIALIIGGSVVLLYQIGVNNNIPKKEIIRIVRNLDYNELNCIKLYSSSNYGLGLQDTIIVSDSINIKQFASGFNKMKRYQPHSPHAKWEVNLSIELKNDSLKNIDFEIMKNEEGRYIIYIDKTLSFGSFRLGVYSNEKIGKLVEELIQSHS
jgi:hypothetical protein